MTYLSDKIEKLEEQNALLKEANEQLKEKIDTSQTNGLIEENEKLKKEKKSMDSEEQNNIKKLQQRNYNLVVENEFLKEQIDTSKTSRLISENNRLNEICIYWEREHDVLAEEIEKLIDVNSELLEKIDELNGYIEQLKKEKEEINNDCLRLVKEYNLLKRERYKLIKENLKLKMKINK